MIKVIAIAAMSENRVVGIDNKLPWRISEDMEHFRELTTPHTVLMGRKTFDSIPSRYRPLAERQNIVASQTLTNLENYPQVKVINSVNDYIKTVKTGTEKIQGDTLWIAGGGQIYKETMPLWDEVELTLVNGEYQGDAYFPEFENSFEVVSEIKKEFGFWLKYSRKN